MPECRIDVRQTWDRMLLRMSDRNAHPEYQINCHTLPDNMPGRMWTKCQKGMPDGIPDRTSEYISNIFKMSDRMSDCHKKDVKELSGYMPLWSRVGITPLAWLKPTKNQRVTREDPQIWKRFCSIFVACSFLLWPNVKISNISWFKIFKIPSSQMISTSDHRQSFELS